MSNLPLHISALWNKGPDTRPERKEDLGGKRSNQRAALSTTDQGEQREQARMAWGMSVGRR